MKTEIAAILSAALLLPGCGRQAARPEAVATRRPSPLRRPTVPVVPAAQLRSSLRDAYRLRPDGRFLLAFGEVHRLAAEESATPETAATAAFSEGKWAVRLGESSLGSLPELPDFPDYFQLLVAQARSAMPRASASPPASRDQEHDAFLMPGLLDGLRSAEQSWRESRSPRNASRSFARLAFQMTDRLEVAPLIPARALALLAMTRAREARAGVEEEVLLAHALGYTSHAEALARTLPAGSPLRLFEGLEDEALWQLASKAGSSDEVRYLALRRTTGEGDLARWKEARARFFPGDSSPAVMATGAGLPLPKQVEVGDKRDLLAEALPRAVLRELAGGQTSAPGTDPTSPSDFDARLERAAAAAKGPLWDGAALAAYYEAMFHAPLSLQRENWIRWAPTLLTKRLLELSADNAPRDSGAQADSFGAPILIERAHRKAGQGSLGYPQVVPEMRRLVRWLDARPSHRSELAEFSHYNLLDPRAAEDLHRSLIQVLGDGSGKSKADSALYLGDWATLERLAGAPQIKAPEASLILWSWHVSHSEPGRLDREYQRLMERFPGDWNLASFYIDFLRDQKKYREACEVGERWLDRNKDRRTPGYFHAHIRLAHNYVLDHQFEKGRRLLEGMNESERFQRTIIKRGLAECLAGLGQLPQAESLMREVVGWIPWDPEDVRDFVRILWAEGKDKEAAETLADPKHSLSGWEVCSALSDDLAEVFLDRPAERLKSAVDAIVKRPALSRYYRCASSGFAKAGRWEQALRVSGQFAPSGSEQMDLLILRYEYTKNWKGREAAAEWLKAQIPAGQLNPLSMKALYSKNDDLLWDVIATPDPNNHPEWVWLFRACAFALRGTDQDPHRADLLAYFAKDSPAPYHVMGRYLLGLASEAEMFALATTPERISEVAYYLGARAQGDRRFRDACEWYRVAAESREQTSPRTLALYTLSEWVGTPQGIWKLEVQKKGPS